MSESSSLLQTDGSNYRLLSLIILNALGPVAQILACQIDLLGIGQSIGAPSKSTSKFQPANVAFSIWGLIFPCCVIYGIYQAFPSQRSNPTLKSTRLWSAIAFWSTTVWAIVAITAAPAENELLYQIFLCALLAGGIALPLSHPLFLTFAKDSNTANSIFSADSLMVYFPMSIFCAWTTAASFVNFGGVLVASGAESFGLSGRDNSGVVAFTTICGVIVSALIYLSRGNLPYTGVFIWAYSWIAQVNYKRGDEDIGLTAALFVFAFSMSYALSAYFTCSRQHPKQSRLLNDEIEGDGDGVMLEAQNPLTKALES
jgi:hypothetical protein